MKRSVETVRAVRRRIHIPLTVGGGVRSVDDARGLLAAGADKVSGQHGRRPGSEPSGAAEPGIRHTMRGVGHRRTPIGRQLGHPGGGREGRRPVSTRSSGDARARSLGAGEILLTSWDRDGTREGCDVELLRSHA